MAALGLAAGLTLRLPGQLAAHGELSSNQRHNGSNAALLVNGSAFFSGSKLTAKPATGVVRGGDLRVQASAAEAEPKWKQKLAAADAQAEKTRQLTAQAQEIYKRKQMAIRQSAGEGAAADSLAALPFVPYLTEEGKFTDCSDATAKATVYAIFDDDKALQYIGISRGVYQSMRLHFARRPRQCSWVKLQHITRPSRAALEAIKDRWIAENGTLPAGNDGGEVQNLWENPLDCKPLMTEEERQRVEEAAPGPPTAKAYKMVARRVEAELEEGFKARRCTETLRFDPKLKEQALLDLKSAVVTAGPDTSIPSDTPKGEAAAAK